MNNPKNKRTHIKNLISVIGILWVFGFFDEE